MNNFLPTTTEEIKELGWDRPDIIIVSGDAYLDSPYNGAALIGRLLQSHGYKTAIIAQPDMETDDIARLGEPKLFWGVSSGCVDSMVANYTASKKQEGMMISPPPAVRIINVPTGLSSHIRTSSVKKTSKKTLRLSL